MTEAVQPPAAPTERPPSDPLRAGREASARHVWQEAFDLLSLADSEAQSARTPDAGGLSGADLEALGEASRKWFEALRPVYDDLIYYLELAPEDETAREIRKLIAEMDTAFEMAWSLIPNIDTPEAVETADKLGEFYVAKKKLERLLKDDRHAVRIACSCPDRLEGPGGKGS